MAIAPQSFVELAWGGVGAATTLLGTVWGTLKIIQTARNGGNGNKATELNGERWGRMDQLLQSVMKFQERELAEVLEIHRVNERVADCVVRTLPILEHLENQLVAHDMQAKQMAADIVELRRR